MLKVMYDAMDDYDLSYDDACLHERGTIFQCVSGDILMVVGIDESLQKNALVTLAKYPAVVYPTSGYTRFRQTKFTTILLGSEGD